MDLGTESFTTSFKVVVTLTWTFKVNIHQNMSLPCLIVNSKSQHQIWMAWLPAIKDTVDRAKFDCGKHRRVKLLDLYVRIILTLIPSCSVKLKFRIRRKARNAYFLLTVWIISSEAYFSRMAESGGRSTTHALQQRSIHRTMLLSCLVVNNKSQHQIWMA